MISELDSTVADLVRSPALAGADPVGDALGDVGVAWFLGLLTEASRLTPFNQAPPFGTPFICELSFHFRILDKLYMTQPAGTYIKISFSESSREIFHLKTREPKFA